MAVLEKRVSDYIKNEVLNFSNFPSAPDFKITEEQVVARLISRKWSGSAQTENAKELTKTKVKNILAKKLPFIFCFCFGGYKHFWSESYPTPDWAEIFTLRYLLEFLGPIAEKYKPGVTIEYESEEVFVDLINNMPRKSIDEYRNAFFNLLKFVQNKLKMPIKLNCVLARELYNIKELFEITKKYEPAVAERLKALPPEEHARRLKRAESNFMWNGEKDFTKLSKAEREKVIFQSRVTNEAFLDADYDLRGASYFEKENLIPLLGTFGLYAGGENWLHIMSTSSSLVDFWSGIGILEVREDRIIQKIISQKQFNEIKDKLVKIQIAPNTELTKIGKNYSWIYVYEGKLVF